MTTICQPKSSRKEKNISFGKTFAITKERKHGCSSCTVLRKAENDDNCAIVQAAEFTFRVGDNS